MNRQQIDLIEHNIRKFRTKLSIPQRQAADEMLEIMKTTRDFALLLQDVRAQFPNKDHALRITQDVEAAMEEWERRE